MEEEQVRAFVSEFRHLIRDVANEDELRHSFVTAVQTIVGIRDLKLEWNHQDVRRNHVIIEFKDKGLFHGLPTSSSFQQAARQLTRQYIPDQARADNRPTSDYIGVCFDGDYLAFAFVEQDGRERITDLVQFDEHSAGALLRALEQDDRIELTPANVIAHFGPGSAVAAAVIGSLWEDLNNALDADVNRVQMLYAEWNDLFEQSTSLGRIARARLDSHLSSMGIRDTSDPTRVLFVLHTYHALVFKLLAAETVLANLSRTVIPGLPIDYCFRTSGMDDLRLMQSLMNDIEESRLFRQVNILNFVEGSFFSWYLYRPSTRLISAIRSMMQQLTLYRLHGLRLSQTRDIVKRVYEALLPPALRHNIGEFFTPEWLVEFTLDRVGYQDPSILDRKYLDPCCGSGNFLIHAISRYREQAHLAGWTDSKTLTGILDHINGFDLNPLAVLTARVNYLIAISDLIETSSEIEIPVYQADAVYAPSLIRGDADTPLARVYQIDTRRQTIDLTLPESLIIQNRIFARILETMEQAIKHGDSEQVFLSTLEAEPGYARHTDRVVWETYLTDMYQIIQNLESHDWNRIWCRIIRNYFASVAVGKCDFIAGNPPWVRWSELPSRYTARIKPTCEQYGIFSKDTFFGGNELDISGMITYTVADKWLKDSGGQLSFVITQTHFQSQSSGGFRKFRVNNIPLRVVRVDDFVKAKPWPGLGNKPAVLTMEKGAPTVYPVRYFVWEHAGRTISQDANWSAAENQLQNQEYEANPLRGEGQRWSILLPGRFSSLSILDGEDTSIRGRKGIVTDLNGAYFVSIQGQGRLPGTVRITNNPEDGRKTVPTLTMDVELDLLYPLIKGGGNIRAFHATWGPLVAIIPNKLITPEAIPLMSQLPPGAHRYFQAVNGAANLLDLRSTWRTRMKPAYMERVTRGEIDRNDLPVYAIYDVGDYTFAPYKVVWAEMSGTLQAAVISTGNIPYGGGAKPIVPDHKVYFAAFDNATHAHYVCALLNSRPVRSFVDSFTIKIQVGAIFRHLCLPTFDSTRQDCVTLAHLSSEAHHVLAAAPGSASIDTQQAEIDALAQQILSRTIAQSR